MCLYVYIHINTHACMVKHIYMIIRIISLNRHVSICVYTHIYIMSPNHHMSICVYTHICVYACVYKHIYVMYKNYMNINSLKSFSNQLTYLLDTPGGAPTWARSLTCLIRQVAPPLGLLATLQC